jgi:hypothetical protein
MNFVLRRPDNQQLKISMLDWLFYLNFADEYGWQPEGTIPPENHDAEAWHGRYDSKEGQTVSMQDAQALVEALGIAINDKAYEHRVENAYLPLQSDLRKLFSVRSKPEFNPWKILKQIKVFIAFAEGNEFCLM